MNWKWIGILGSLSVVSSVLTVCGVMPQGGAGIAIGLVVGLGFSYVMARTTVERFFRNGFTLGVVGATIGELVQLLFFNTMLENNPKMAEGMEKLPPGMNPILISVIMAPIIIAFSGTVQGLMTLGMAAAMGKRSGRRVVPPTAPPSPV